MKKLLQAALCILTLLYSSAFCLANASDAEYVPVITVNGDGSAYGDPDKAVISIGVASFDKDADSAQRDNASKSRDVIEAISSLGISKADIQTSSYSFNPSYSRDENDNTITEGYHVSNIVTVNVESIANTGRVIDSALAAGANKINSMEFGIRNSEPLKKAALKNAISDARSKAEVIADSLGVKIIGIKSVSESVINIHNRDYANSVMNMSMKETSIAPGTMEFNANVVIEFVIK